MHSQLRKIGNSRGIIIPAAFLEACGLGEEVNLRVARKTHVIEAIIAPRSGWFDNYQPETDVDEFASLPPAEADDEWQL